MSSPRLPVLAIVALAAGLAAAACTTAPASVTFPPVGATVPPAGSATMAARTEVANALGVEGLQVVDVQVPVRPPEGARFAGAPRTVIQVVLAQDPTHGYIVLYAFPTFNDALAAASDQAAYIASGPGRVQFQTDTRFVLRVTGSTAVFFAWSPDNSPDPHTPSIALALSTVGTEVPVPG